MVAAFPRLVTEKKEVECKSARLVRIGGRPWQSTQDGKQEVGLASRSTQTNTAVDGDEEKDIMKQGRLHGTRCT